MERGRKLEEMWLVESSRSVTQIAQVVHLWWTSLCLEGWLGLSPLSVDEVRPWGPTLLKSSWLEWHRIHDLRPIAYQWPGVNPRSGQSEILTKSPSLNSVVRFSFSVAVAILLPPHISQNYVYHWTAHHSLIICHHIETASGKGRPCSFYVFVSICHSLCLSLSTSDYSVCPFSLEFT